ncbi:MAG: hypothetical protein ACE5MI_05035 [Acidimicrobiia bacterium]
MNGVLADLVPEVELDYPVGNPLYDTIPEHQLALLTVLLVPLGVWLLARYVLRSATQEKAWAVRWLAGYRGLSQVHRLAVWLLLTSGIVHLMLIPGHGLDSYSVLFLVAGIWMLRVAHRAVTARRWRREAVFVLLGTIVAYALLSMGGEAPDQLGMLTKLIEIVAFGLVVIPVSERKRGRLGASVATSALVIVTGVGSWIGAFETVSAEAGHHSGEYPEPGTVIPFVPDRQPTAAEQAAADELYAATVATVAPYRDPAVAAADGYVVGEIVGTDFHAPNPKYQSDGVALDPERPENLVYAATPKGPVLLGVMYEMPGLGNSGPTVGGPLTLWHSHEGVCFSLIPVGLSGLVSPFGTCPVGSLAIPTTNEMIHVWTVPGVPDRFGHLSEDWLSDYLQEFSG